MFQQITKGIKISVKIAYKGIIYKGNCEYYSFSYFVSIENKSSDSVKLTDRFWTIIDSLNITEFVEGEGVVGQTPVILPGDQYNYTSNCFLVSNIGAMFGKYKMLNLDTKEEFFVNIPTFQLITTPVLN